MLLTFLHTNQNSKINCRAVWGRRQPRYWDDQHCWFINVCNLFLSTLKIHVSAIFYFPFFSWSVPLSCLYRSMSLSFCGLQIILSPSSSCLEVPLKHHSSHCFSISILELYVVASKAFFLLPLTVLTNNLFVVTWILFQVAYLHILIILVEVLLCFNDDIFNVHHSRF